ncbi:MAG: TRAP transporter substrate-binding protein [Kiloniellales bacterium]
MIARLCGALALTFALGVALHPSAAGAEAVKLRMATWLPAVHHLPKSLQAWADEVEKASGGSLVIEIDKAPIAKPPGQYDLVKKAIADMAYPVLAYTPGRFHILRATELPFLSPSAEVGSQAAWDWYARNVGEKEFEDVKLITFWIHGPGHLHTKTEVKTLADLKGLKLRVGGGGVAMSEALGAVPVPMSATKAHESLLRGTTDGTMFPWEAIAGFRLTDLVTFHLEIPGGLYATPFALVMNRDKFESLSAEHQAVLTKMGGINGAKFIGVRWDEADRKAREGAVANGNTVQALGAAELENWRNKIQFMDSDWVKKAKDEGWDGEALLSDLRATMKKFAMGQ